MMGLGGGLGTRQLDTDHKPHRQACIQIKLGCRFAAPLAENMLSSDNSLRLELTMAEPSDHSLSSSDTLADAHYARRSIESLKGLNLNKSTDLTIVKASRDHIRSGANQEPEELSQPPMMKGQR